MFRALVSAIMGLSFLLPLSAQQATPSAQAPEEQQSLADIARSIRARKKPEVILTYDDAAKLFDEVDSLLSFASESSHLKKKDTVRYKLIGKDEADKHLAETRKDNESVRRIQRSELVLKKFGMLPPDFHMSDFFGSTSSDDVSAFYDTRDKSIYLLNWIPLDQQRRAMVHELTHALQDQNFNLNTWCNPNPDPTADNEGREPEARVAAAEGQAMLVYLDYDIRPAGMKLSDSTARFDTLKTRLLSVYESPVKFHGVPLIFSEVARFPYYDGFAFELEVLKHGGTDAAFTGVFTNPPRDSHEILQPEAYLSGIRPEPFVLPNLMPALGSNYRYYDSGAIGELDVRTMAKQFGRDEDAYAISPSWDGGAYLAARRPAAATKKDSDLTPADLVLVYISRWKDNSSAERFAEIYKASVLRRSSVFDAAAAKASRCNTRTPDCTARWYSRFETEEGPTVIEVSPNNTLLIAQGLDDPTVAQIKIALSRKENALAAHPGSELSLRLLDFPEIRAMSTDFARDLLREAAAH